MGRIGPLMTDKYAQRRPRGRGNQGMYVTAVPLELANTLIGLIGKEANELLSATGIRDDAGMEVADPLPEVLEWEDHISHEIQNDAGLDETERSSIVIARRGQGQFKRNVQLIEVGCRITGVQKIEHLVASHCKPWRDCETNTERLDGENGVHFGWKSPRVGPAIGQRPGRIAGLPVPVGLGE